MMKISWGQKIAITYLGFVIFMLILVFMAMRQKFELISPDYYIQELTYQKKIDAANHANALKIPLDIQVEGNNVRLHFPQEQTPKNISGEILVLCPSDAERDFRSPISLDNEGKQDVSSSKWKKGLYSIHINWIYEDTPYYVTKSIFFN